MMKMKEWKYDDMTSKMLNYGGLVDAIDVERTGDEINMVAVVDGYVTITSRVEVLKETTKAFQLRIADTWTEWCPKSAVIF